MLRELGARVIDADEAARAVYEPGTPGFAAVVKEFGPEIVRDGRIDRQRLGEHRFQRHGGAGAAQRDRSSPGPGVDGGADGGGRGGGASVVVQDIPLLFENGYERMFSDHLLVYVPQELQVERLVRPRVDAGDGRAQMIAAQMPIDEKRRLAHHIIDNSGTIEATRAHVDQIWPILVKPRP